MLDLNDLKPGLALVGLEPTLVATIAAVVPIAEGTVQVLYKTPGGTIKERLLSRADEASLSPATTDRPWSFDGDGAAFQLACEAKRIDLAFLFDPMMAVHTSNVEALPHQITAVYQSMLPRQPLRYVLADDPGAGKTIMAGLYLRELILRADARRILIVAPGSLVEQWRGDAPPDPVAAQFAADPAARSRIERLAMDAVRRAEEAAGCRVEDVPREKCGWDLTSYPPALDGREVEVRHIEVKGRVKGAATITVTRNEMLYAVNQGEKFLLAIVLVGDDDAVEGPFYVRDPFDREPDWGVASVNYELEALLRKAEGRGEEKGNRK